MLESERLSLVSKELVGPRVIDYAGPPPSRLVRSWRRAAELISESLPIILEEWAVVLMLIGIGVFAAGIVIRSGLCMLAGGLLARMMLGYWVRRNDRW